MRKKFVFLISSVLTTIFLSSVSAIAEESSFSDGVYQYKGTGYTHTQSGSNTLVAKIDTYYYKNLSDIEYCADDVYFSKRNSSGVVTSTNVYGYAVARFERGNNVYASSGRVYGYENVEAWSSGCSWLNFATPHYYGNAIAE